MPHLVLQTNLLHVLHVAWLECNSRYPMLSAEKAPWLCEDHDLDSSHVDEYRVDYFPLPIWRDETLHDLIVRAALGAADALAQSGRSMRMGQHVLVRSDVVLTHLDGVVSNMSAAIMHWLVDKAMFMAIVLVPTACRLPAM